MLSTHQPLVKIGEPFIILSEVDSTNNYALKLIQDGLGKNGTVIFAQHQTKGRGQVGKIWQANVLDNILMSIIFDITAIPIQNQVGLSFLTALSCHEFFNKYSKDGTAIKWSNDIYWNDKKAGGILIEISAYKNSRFAVLGIGLNINQIKFDKSLPNPVSLKQITGKEFDVINLAKELCLIIEKWSLIFNQNNIKELNKSYNKVLYKKGKEVTIKKKNIKFNCTIKEVNLHGELVVENGIKKTYKFGEISWVV